MGMAMEVGVMNTYSLVYIVFFILSCLVMKITDLVIKKTNFGISLINWLRKGLDKKEKEELDPLPWSYILITSTIYAFIALIDYHNNVIV